MASAIRSMKYNYIMNLVLTASNMLFPLITFPYFARILEPSGIGKVAFVQSFIAYFVLFAQLGVPIYGIKKCAQVRDDKLKLSKTVHELLMLGLVTMGLSYIFLFITIYSFNKIEAYKNLIILMSSQMMFSILGINWLYASLEKYAYITKRSILFKIISIILMFILVNTKNDSFYYALCMVIGISGSNVLNLIYAKKYIFFKWLKNYNIKQHIRPVFLLFTTNVAISIYVNLDTIMIGLIAGDIEVGYYNAAIKINRILLQVVTALGIVLLPRLAYLVNNNLIEEFGRTSRKAIHFVLLVSIPLVFYFAFFANDVIHIIGGNSFTPSIIILQIIMPVITIAGLSNITGIQMLVPLNQEKKLMYSVILGALANIVLNIFLIPSYGALGASIATVIAELIVLSIQVYFVKQFLFVGKIDRFGQQLRKVVFVILSIFFTLILLKMLDLQNITIRLLMTFTLYLMAYILLLRIIKDNIALEVIALIRKKLQKSR